MEEQQYILTESFYTGIRIRRLAELCTELHLYPLHLADVVGDFLAE